MRVDDIGGAAYEPGSGFTDPNATTSAVSPSGSSRASRRPRTPRFRSTRFAGGALWVDPTGCRIERLTISR